MSADPKITDMSLLQAAAILLIAVYVTTPMRNWVENEDEFCYVENGVISPDNCVSKHHNETKSGTHDSRSKNH